MEESGRCRSEWCRLSNNVACCRTQTAYRSDGTAKERKYIFYGRYAIEEEMRIVVSVFLTMSIMFMAASVFLFAQTAITASDCEEGEWLRTTCDDITCSPHSAMTIFKTVKCGHRRQKTIKANCFVRRCEWPSREVKCSIRGGREERTMLLFDTENATIGLSYSLADSIC
ncbi:hypothetical protein Tcan_15583 [Toxocara canis]|uniref:Uncharacterized protein n=1 Tax=Toxocara canis TaxID=6265 RepID=A0A0B2VHI4_TOXCA|nr:hypothetical protein Tcan_15583 [Toxocara canis]